MSKDDVPKSLIFYIKYLILKSLKIISIQIDIAYYTT